MSTFVPFFAMLIKAAQAYALPTTVEIWKATSPAPVRASDGCDLSCVNALEVIAFLAELKRRTQDPGEHGERFFNTGLPGSFYVLSKGRSSSGRLNRLCRRVTAVNIATALLPISLWTISKWNFSDGASRKYEQKSSSGLSRDRSKDEAMLSKISGGILSLFSRPMGQISAYFSGAGRRAG